MDKNFKLFLWYQTEDTIRQSLLYRILETKDTLSLLKYSVKHDRKVK